MKTLSILESLPRLGALIAALGCASCFPALGSLAAAIGLGFLSRFEGVLINQILPLIALLALFLALVHSFVHRNPVRTVFALAGPGIVLAVLYPLWNYSWSTPLFYLGLLLMIGASVLDLLKPAGAVKCPS